MEGILPVIRRHSGCDYHRIINPLTYLGYDFKHLPKHTTIELLEKTKLIMFNRKSSTPFTTMTRVQKKYGFKILLDLDDYWELNVLHPMYKTWNKNETGKKIFEWVKHADAITVTTQRLADKVYPYNKNVHVLPNALPYDEGQFTDITTESDKLRFVYAAASSHVFDVQVLKYAIEKVKMINAEFILAGYDINLPLIWNKIESPFKQANNYRRVNGKSLLTYMDCYDADVALAPLEANMFTAFKSNLKILEAGCKNLPIICSNVPPYSDEPPTLGIMYASNTREWVEWFQWCVRNPTAVKELGQQLGQYVREHYNLRKINEHRKQIIESLIN